jgi:hypothetical protein
MNRGECWLVHWKERGGLHPVVQTVCTVLYIDIALKCGDHVLIENGICFVNQHS